MSVHWWRYLRLALMGGALVGSQAPPAPVQAALPTGLTIGQTASCVVRSGGFEGYKIEYQFDWFYPTSASLGAHLTIGGSYSIQVHNPETGEYETLFSYPYGVFLEPDRGEKRFDRLSPREPRWAFDQIRMETTWRIEETGGSGTETKAIGCDIQPAPEGREVITPSAYNEYVGNNQPAATESETFVDVADPSPYPALTVTSSLHCIRTSGTGAQEVNWSLIATNTTIGGGVTVSGILRAYSRTPQSDYTLVQESPFALVMLANETNAVDGFTASRGMAAAKLEVEWHASLGMKANEAAPAQHILRTTACTS